MFVFKSVTLSQDQIKKLKIPQGKYSVTDRLIYSVSEDVLKEYIGGYTGSFMSLVDPDDKLNNDFLILLIDSEKFDNEVNERLGSKYNHKSILDIALENKWSDKVLDTLVDKLKKTQPGKEGIFVTYGFDYQGKIPLEVILEQTYTEDREKVNAIKRAIKIANLMGDTLNYSGRIGGRSALGSALFSQSPEVCLLLLKKGLYQFGPDEGGFKPYTDLNQAWTELKKIIVDGYDSTRWNEVIFSHPQLDSLIKIIGFKKASELIFDNQSNNELNILKLYAYSQARTFEHSNLANKQSINTLNTILGLTDPTEMKKLLPGAIINAEKSLLDQTKTSFFWESNNVRNSLNSLPSEISNLPSIQNAFNPTRLGLEKVKKD